MRHIKSELGCGYSGRTCVGIPQFPPKPLQVFCDTDPGFDGREYNCKEVSPGVFVCDTAFNNFLNLPIKFQGIVRSTPYIELGKFEYKSTNCVQSYDPFTSNGLFDAFNQISRKPQFIAAYGDYNAELQCYASDSLQQPGVLIPSVQLNEFAAVPLQAVPTVALAAVSALAQGGASDFSLQSACKGFNISVRRVSTNKVKLSVKAGKVYTQTTGTGQPIAIDLKAIQWSVGGADDSDSKADPSNMRVYLVLQYKAQTDQWVGKIQKQTGEVQSQVTVGYKRILLGTASYKHGYAKVLQTTCSPVDARLGTDVRKASTSAGQDQQVLTWGSASYAKKWMLVKDCG